MSNGSRHRGTGLGKRACIASWLHHWQRRSCPGKAFSQVMSISHSHQPGTLQSHTSALLTIPESPSYRLMSFNHYWQSERHKDTWEKQGPQQGPPRSNKFITAERTIVLLTEGTESEFFLKLLYCMVLGINSMTLHTLGKYSTTTLYTLPRPSLYLLYQFLFLSVFLFWDEASAKLPMLVLNSPCHPGKPWTCKPLASASRGDRLQTYATRPGSFLHWKYLFKY